MCLVWYRAEMHAGFWWRHWKVKVYLEELGLNGGPYYNGLFSDRTGGVEWVDLAQDRYRCKALVSAVMNHCVPLDAKSFLFS
jgi:hypothetical protein